MFKKEVVNEDREPWCADWQIVVNGNEKGKASKKYDVAWVTGEVLPDKYKDYPFYEEGAHTGILVMHPVAINKPAKLKLKKVVIPEDKPILQVIAANSINGDCLLRCLVDGVEIGTYVLFQQEWITCRFDLAAHSGKKVDVELWNITGGTRDWSSEHCFIDDISFQPRN